MNQGDLMSMVAGAEQRTVLVVSNDSYNQATGVPLVMRVVRTGPPSPYLVPMGDPDPIGGRVVVGSVGPVAGEHLRNLQGVITGATLERVRAAMRLLFEL